MKTLDNSHDRNAASEADKLERNPDDHPPAEVKTYSIKDHPDWIDLDAEDPRRFDREKPKKRKKKRKK